MDCFQLSLCSTDNTFSAGQTVEGIVRVYPSEPMAVDTIVVRLTGRVRTWFEKQEPLVNDKNEAEYKSERYAAEQECLNSSVDVFRVKPCNNVVIAQNEFPFSFLLPVDVPPSFEGKHGSVAYACEAVLHRTEWYRANSVTAKKITIVPGLVASPTDSIPRKKDIVTEVGWLCCVRGRIFATVMVPTSTFSPGEPVPISLDIRNDSTRTVKRLELALVERSSFVGKKASVRLCNDRKCSLCYCGGLTTTVLHEKVLVRMDEELAVGPYVSMTFRRTLTLPQSVVPSFEDCAIVQNRHFIKISLVPENGSCTTAEVPIKIRSQEVKRLSLSTENSTQKGAENGPAAPLGTECFAYEKSLYPKGVSISLVASSWCY